jgi:hypothetical protein
MVPAFERAKTVHALDHAATVIGSAINYLLEFHNKRNTESLGARGSIVGLGTMLQAGRSRVRGPMRSLDFFQFT